MPAPLTQPADKPAPKPTAVENPSLSKTDALMRLHDEIDEEEAELARKVMEVSPKPSSEGSHSNIKDELKESLRSENFFLNKMDSTGPATQQTSQSKDDQASSQK